MNVQCTFNHFDGSLEDKERIIQKIQKICSFVKSDLSVQALVSWSPFHSLKIILKTEFAHKIIATSSSSYDERQAICQAIIKLIQHIHELSLKEEEQKQVVHLY